EHRSGESLEEGPPVAPTSAWACKSGGFLDLRNELFKRLVETVGGHGAISELGPPPKPGTVCLDPIPGGHDKNDLRLANETITPGQPSCARLAGRPEAVPSLWTPVEAGSVRDRGGGCELSRVMSSRGPDHANVAGCDGCSRPRRIQ